MSPSRGAEREEAAEVDALLNPKPAKTHYGPYSVGRVLLALSYRPEPCSAGRRAGIGLSACACCDPGQGLRRFRDDSPLKLLTGGKAEIESEP
jgi:hypothetical protein